ncbi:hypothetical protein ACS0TY_021813 [Phlomoides rotata]
MKVGGNHTREVIWKELIHKVKKKIANWDGRLMSLAGRAALVHSVLSTVPIYYLSFFLLPKTVINKLTSLQRSFLSGGNDYNYKTPWVKWGVVCKKKKAWGLGVRELGKFNRAFVGKCIWRVLIEKDSLWVRVVESRYGRLELREQDDRIVRKENYESLWWRDVKKIFWGLNGVGLRRDFSNIVGNGNNTSFWNDEWIDGECLRCKFPRLYRLSLQKHSNIGETGNWVNGTWVWDWK